MNLGRLAVEPKVSHPALGKPEEQLEAMLKKRCAWGPRPLCWGLFVSIRSIVAEALASQWHALSLPRSSAPNKYCACAVCGC